MNIIHNTPVRRYTLNVYEMGLRLLKYYRQELFFTDK
jgi:hypothetical protein